MEMLSTGGFSQIEEEVVYLGSLGVIWASSALYRPFQEACSIFSSEKHLQANRKNRVECNLLQRNEQSSTRRSMKYSVSTGSLPFFSKAIGSAHFHAQFV